MAPDTTRMAARLKPLTWEQVAALLLESGKRSIDPAMRANAAEVADEIAKNPPTHDSSLQRELAEARAEIESLKSRASLTPLTDESVRGVLVTARHGDPPVNDVIIDGMAYQLRPASEFGVPAESSDLQAERDQLDVMCHEGAARCERLKERVRELEARVKGLESTLAKTSTRCGENHAEAGRLRKAIEEIDAPPEPTK